MLLIIREKIDCLLLFLLLEPIKLSGHNGAIRQALFLDNDNLLITSSDDHSVRLWDLTTNEQIRKMVFPHVPSDIELSRDGTLLTVASDNTVSFYEIRNLDEDNLLRQHQMPTTVYSASLSPDKSIFICGGLDFKMYKYNFDDGTELGKLIVVVTIKEVVLDA